MTRKELIQTPQYWEELYKNECGRLGIDPVLKFIKPFSEEELDRLANINNPYDIESDNYGNRKPWYEGFKAGYRNLLE